jgi:hypothetical protein
LSIIPNRPNTEIMRSALRQLCRHGIEALRPQKVNDRWRKPVISRRVAADLRKAALRSGTYGSFDAGTGLGWDPAWDTPDRRLGGGTATAVDLAASDVIIPPATTGADGVEGGIGSTAAAAAAPVAADDPVDADADVAVAGAVGGGRGSNAGSIQSIRPPKGHKRDRTREARARKIEDLVAKADDRIEEYRLEREKNRPLPGIEEEFKRAVKGSSW